MLTTLPPSCTVVMKSGNLKFLETSGPFQACKGNALPFYFAVFLIASQGDCSVHLNLENTSF